jgi:hypothetical protein
MCSVWFQKRDEYLKYAYAESWRVGTNRIGSCRKNEISKVERHRSGIGEKISLNGEMNFQ